jgi:hypothetical protein
VPKYKVSRYLQHARKVNAAEAQDIKTFGGLAEFVQSRMMFAEGGGSFHPGLLALENAITSHGSSTATLTKRTSSLCWCGPQSI